MLRGQITQSLAASSATHTTIGRSAKKSGQISLFPHCAPVARQGRTVRTSKRRSFGGNMLETRRAFVKTLTAAAGVLAARSALGQTQIRKPTIPKPPTPGDPQEKDKNANELDAQTVNRAAMQQNEK